MDNQHVLFLGCVTLAIAISAFVLWGPTPRPKSKKGQIVGLINLGSTCFLNTLLQALASCAVFIQWLSQQKQERNSLTSSLHHVLWVLNGEGNGNTYAPFEILSSLKRHGWMIAGEQDAHELFNVIVSSLQEESNKAVKILSLSDALSATDTLSEASELSEDNEAGAFEEINGNESLGNESPVIRKRKNLKKVNLGYGDVNRSTTAGSGESSNDTIANYEDAVEKMNQGDSFSHSSTPIFYSIEDEYSSVSNNANDCGDVDDYTIKQMSELQNSKDNSSSKTNLSKSRMSKFKTSQESFKERSPEFFGCYDRLAGCCPSISQPDTPPFQGLLTSTLQCSACGHHSSVRYDTFDSVSLPLNDNNFSFQVQKLQDLLKKFVKTEIIPDVDCDRCCEKTTAFKTLNFGKLPPCLCLRIERISWQMYSHTPTKREDYVDFPEFLPMDEYTVSARMKKDSMKNSVQSVSEEVNITNEKVYKHLYRLKSVVVHLGGVNSGHFLTYRRGALNTDKRHRVGKLAGACMDSKRWYLTSDDNVKLSTLYEVMNSIAYMLFYEKCLPESALSSETMNETTNETISETMSETKDETRNENMNKIITETMNETLPKNLSYFENEPIGQN